MSDPRSYAVRRGNLDECRSWMESDEGTGVHDYRAVTIIDFEACDLSHTTSWENKVYNSD